MDYCIIIIIIIIICSVCVCVCVCGVPNTCDKLPHMLFTSIQFVVPWRRQKCTAETCSTVVLHVKYKRCAAVVSQTCAYQIAALKVNSSKRNVTDRLKKNCNLWNYCCSLKEGKFDLGSGCTKGSLTLWYLQKVTHLFQSKIYLTKVQSSLRMAVNNITCFLYFLSVSNFHKCDLISCKPDM